jgi:tousled-like kinase
MLYGQRPFGHNQSQEQLLSNRTMENLHAVVFPDETSGWLKDKGKFKVSDAAKDFIRTCLKQHGRPDVQALCEHHYLRAPEKTPKK